MIIDLRDYAAKLNVIDCFQPGNSSGVVTDKRLYDPGVQGSAAPRWLGARGILLHGTVGTNSLRYLAGGSVADGRWVCAHYLIPKDAYTVYKLVPSTFGCNHAGDAQWRGVGNLNGKFIGIEVENRQNEVEPFTDDQHIKAALVVAYEAALHRLPDLMLTSHASVALPPGRRRDPDAGPWMWSTFYAVLYEIRRAQNWPALWGVPRWTGGQNLEFS